MNCLKAIKYLLLVYKTGFFFIRALKSLICRNFKQICVSNFKHHLRQLSLSLTCFYHYLIIIFMFHNVCCSRSYFSCDSVRSFVFRGITFLQNMMLKCYWFFLLSIIFGSIRVSYS